MPYFCAFLLEILILFLLNRSLNIYLVSILAKGFKNKKILMYIIYFFYLPSVFFHEFAHFIIAKALFLRVKTVRLFPKLEDDNKYLLGSVRFEDGGLIRNFLAGSAPFWLGNFTLFLLINELLIFKNIWVLSLILIYTIFQLSNAIILSWADIKVALPAYIIFIAITTFEVLGIIKINFATEVLIDFFKLMNKYLLIPMTINATFGIILAAIYQYGRNQRNN